MNDLLRSAFAKPDGTTGGSKIYFPLEVLAGCGAGAAQVKYSISYHIMSYHVI